ncbi:RsmB/NOP family class I SAM-dependent RNA methyltransferase [Azotosporobacter soli]|uniref:RsmB/NOP family class I SAM-dependent RNA methyltransferase n=1 Tax=Azotosporobacter soli TaxID=3055040 RepID=UPI0031FF1ECC
MLLPKELIQELSRSLKEEDLAAFVASYQEKRAVGLRTNRLKNTPQELAARLPYLTEVVKWCPDGFYYPEGEVRPAKEIDYFAGCYYIQEPSAMLPGEWLAPLPGERVLDLCAAPGGKAVQLGGKMRNSGLLVANEPNSQRAKVLLRNLERCGVANILVLREQPERLAQVFPGFFDRILVDAPCSGEGMFRKEPDMAKEWSEESVAGYVRLQRTILEQALRMLRPGGTLVYSTCTFNRREDEEQIAALLADYPELTLDEERRIWPQCERGEGHFVCRLRKAGDLTSVVALPERLVKVSATAAKALVGFCQDLCGDENAWQNWLPAGGVLVERDEHLIWEHHDLPLLKGLAVQRSGWLLGTLPRGRFKPSQALALGLTAAGTETARKYPLADKGQAIRYLKGETLMTGERGWHLVTWQGHALGWAKGDGTWLKNEYPPGWRWQDSEEA